MSRSLVIRNEQGKKVSCDILFSFDCAVTEKSYLVYTDNSKDDKGNVKVMASIYYPNEKDGNLYPIETDFEWKMIEVILDKLSECVYECEDINDIYKEVGEAVELFFEENKKYQVELKVFSYEEGFLGEVCIEGKDGKFVIGSNQLCDIWMKNCSGIDGIEFLCEYKDGLLMIADISNHLNFINMELMDKKIIYPLNDKDTVQIDLKYSIDVNYITKIDKIERISKEVDPLNYKANYIGDLNLDVYAYNREEPKISNRVLIDNFL